MNIIEKIEALERELAELKATCNTQQMSENESIIAPPPQPAQLTHRQWLAAMAMQGLSDRLNAVPEHLKHSVKHVTELAYAVADAMIEHEKKENRK